MKKLSLILALVLVLSLLTACGGSAQPEAAPAPAAEPEAAAAPAEEAPAEARKIIVGTYGAALPYSYLQDDGTWTGVEADLWDEIVKRTGWEIEVKQCPDMATLFGELDSGRIMVAANCAAITAARLEAHLASDPIYADAQVITVLPDSPYQTFEDLRGEKIGCQAGQAAQNTVEKMASDYDWDVVAYETSAAAFQDLSLGRIPAVAHTVSSVEKYQRELGVDFRMLDEKLFGNNVGWWFQDNEEGAALRDELNAVLADMQADGTVAKITTEWFYEDMTALISDEWLTATR